MKTLLKKLFFIGMGVFFFASCKKDQTIDYFNGGTAPVLSASVSGTIPLSNATQSNVAVTFSWTNPAYLFTTGVSSQNVSYLLEIDTLGANFTNPQRISTSVSPDVSLPYVDATLNSALSNQMGLLVGISHTIQVRVTATLNGSAATSLVSNVLQFNVTLWAPPPGVAPPASGTLFITGSATAKGWMVGGTPSSVAGQQLTQVTPLLYKITLPLIGGQQFLIVPVAGDWSNKYATSNASSNPAGDSFSYNAANNFNGPVTSGTYTVTFNFQTGKYTIQ